MAKKQLKFEESEFEAQGFKDLKVEFPLTIRSKCGKHWFRYSNDGRFEMIDMRFNRMSLSFGRYASQLHQLYNEENFFLKVLQQRMDRITNDEFENKLVEFYQSYDKYLKGELFLTEDIQINDSNEPKEKTEEYPF